jgi:hypothetical protein
MKTCIFKIVFPWNFSEWKIFEAKDFRCQLAKSSKSKLTDVLILMEKIFKNAVLRKNENLIKFYTHNLITNGGPEVKLGQGVGKTKLHFHI